uniref:BHLH domain-containing protein n=1 Tax=Oryzias latipes TaxID=8090 RepID=A0A3B3HBI6_ORYLA
CGPEANRASVQALPDSVKEAQRGGRKRARSLLSNNQRRERHNITERERRKRIRLCCDELNTMVPFCDPCTDKVTTLTWTTTFLRYITKKYGDTFKEAPPVHLGNQLALAFPEALVRRALLVAQSRPSAPVHLASLTATRNNR